MVVVSFDVGAFVLFAPRDVMLREDAVLLTASFFIFPAGSFAEEASAAFLRVALAILFFCFHTLTMGGRGFSTAFAAAAFSAVALAAAFNK